MNGMPMMYSGQEAGLDHALPFFEKAPIQWKADTIRIKNGKMKQVISFVREKNRDKVVTIVNLSNEQVKTSLETQYDEGDYHELFTNKDYTLTENDRFDLASWNYLVW